MFEKLAHMMYRRRWFVLGAWAIVLLVAAGLAYQVGSVLGPGDPVSKGSNSDKAEVFLLSRIREGWFTTGDNAASVGYGLQRTGRLISSAALIMIVAFSGFLIGDQIQLKEFGFGLMAAIAIDATLIRLVLAPSLMAMVGRWNWWVPSFLRDFASRGATFDEDDRPSELDEELATA
jgi:uncharacterized membrane protein YdfJ with MMPL/SSD domain